MSNDERGQGPSDCREWVGRDCYKCKKTFYSEGNICPDCKRTQLPPIDLATPESFKNKGFTTTTNESSTSPGLQTIPLDEFDTLIRSLADGATLELKQFRHKSALFIRLHSNGNKEIHEVQFKNMSIDELVDSAMAGAEGARLFLKEKIGIDIFSE